MRHSVLFPALVLWVLPRILTAAEQQEFYYRLPDDGVWCRYYVNLKIAGVETASPWVISSVGTKRSERRKMPLD